MGSGGHGKRDLRVERLDTAEHLDAIIGLASRSLGWAGDERDRAFFVWKHHENPFGRSPAWGAWDGERLVAFRTLLRWELAVDERRLRLVRAVDTATDPDYQGRGLFRRLTTQAVDELTAEGVDAVFNTPNDQSRPGYLKMGWVELGRPTLLVQPSSPVTLARMVRARVPAEKWSETCTYGEPASAVVPAMHPARIDQWATPRTTEHLAWRYGFEPLHYRAIEVRGGHCVFRVRQRGALREVAIVDWASDQPDPPAVFRLVRACGDYAVAIGLAPWHGLVPMPRQGPIVTWRTLANPVVPAFGDIGFALGDLELF
ncbi:MAG TPA: GNAT family N-acetyltransferase [Acidimicrobiales bacterium]|nr:GNAT family N-acetyltransferase [Acidimicrobiales bacterium]